MKLIYLSFCIALCAFSSACREKGGKDQMLGTPHQSSGSNLQVSAEGVVFGGHYVGVGSQGPCVVRRDSPPGDCPPPVRGLIFKVHKMGFVISTIQALGVEVEFIPPGCTGLVQPDDIGYNKSFKTKVKDQYSE